MRKYLLHLFFIALLTPVFSNAQDGRFSQYYNNLVYLNPAFAGNGIEYIRVTGIYRNQWAGLGTPFTTQGFSVDKVVSRVGIGGFIIRNGAGSTGIRTLNMGGNLSYNLPVGEEKINIISAGIQVGLINKSFDQSKMTFDNQYTPDVGYDPTQSSNEIFTSTSVSRPDVNLGLSWQRGWGKKEVRFKPFASMAFSHLNKPDETFIIDNNKAEIKSTLFTGFGYMLNEKTEIRPSAMLLNQGEFKETTFGTMLNYSLANENAVQIGAYNRMNDAIIAYAGYQMNRVMVGMSYDINTSELSSSGKGMNAFEISLTWSPRPVNKKPKKIKEEQPKSESMSMVALINTPENDIRIPDSLENSRVVVIENMSEEPQPIAKSIVPVEISAPPADTDMDGVIDTEDACPYSKGSIATKGCPDSDSDGITDLEDKCPMETGTAARQGCPDPAEPVAESQEMVKKFDNILFDSGKSTLKTEDIYEIIERAIDIMYANKATKVILSGHTDSEGNEYQNMILSQSRAEIVKAYLIKNGIDESRISIVTYGETKPLEDNNTSEGRYLNRRVEMNIVKTK